MLVSVTRGLWHSRTIWRNMMSNGPMLNAYPDSMGGTLDDIVKVLSKEELKDVAYDLRMYIVKMSDIRST